MLNWSPQRQGSQYLSVRYTELLAKAAIEPLVGSVCDSYDTALAEIMNDCSSLRLSTAVPMGGLRRMQYMLGAP